MRATAATILTITITMTITNSSTIIVATVSIIIFVILLLFLLVITIAISIISIFVDNIVTGAGPDQSLHLSCGRWGGVGRVSKGFAVDHDKKRGEIKLAVRITELHDKVNSA